MTGDVLADVTGVAAELPFVADFDDEFFVASLTS